MTKNAIPNEQFEKMYDEKFKDAKTPLEIAIKEVLKDTAQEFFESGFFLGHQKGWGEGVEYGKVPF